MVKKISFYTAYGQFFNMLERQAKAAEEREQDTDRLPISHPLSDYQDAIVSDVQVQSCPANFSEPEAPVTVIRKTVSCPAATWTWHPPYPLLSAPSPIPTSIESRKMNEAAEMMMAFWKVHLALPAEQIPSLFEKFEGLFTSTSSAALSDPFDDTGFTSQLSPVTEFHECAWCDSMKRPPAVAPALPVFVKSPVDSLEYYKKSQQSQTASPDASDSGCSCCGTSETSSSSSSSSSSSHSSGSSCSSKSIQRRLRDKRTRILGEVVAQQNKTIQLLIELNSVTSRLERF